MRVGTLQILRRARDVDRETLAVAGKRNGREQRQSEGEGRKTQGRRGEGEAELRQKMEPARESFRETCCCREALASRSAEQHLSRDAVRLGRRPGGRGSHVPRSPLHSRRNAQRKRRGQRALLQRRGRRWQQGQSRRLARAPPHALATSARAECARVGVPYANIVPCGSTWARAAGRAAPPMPAAPPRAEERLLQATPFPFR